LWRIAAELRYQVLEIPKQEVEEKPSYKTSSYEAYSVKRVKPGRGEPESRQAIATNARVPARSYRLVLFDRDGKVITEL
jgi:hypothetical protein